MDKEPDPWALFQKIEDYQGGAVARDVLAPWVTANQAKTRRWISDFAERKGSPIPLASNEDLWMLYAFSRIIDTLLMSFQPGVRGHAFALSLDDYAVFATALGFAVTREAEFTPFAHEIVTVEQAAFGDAPVALAHEYWPALMLGDMMFSRAGVAVCGGRAHVCKEIAETSTLYWAFRRRNRPTDDLSVGWGSNSQWRTALRRDYRIAGTWHLNVDGERELARAPDVDPDGWTPAARRELLINRCFLTVPDPAELGFPYDDTIRMAIAGSHSYRPP